MKLNYWKIWLKKEFEKPYFQNIKIFINNAYLEKKCFPPKNQIFKIFSICPKEKIKVVILGQDPYSLPNQANGLAFSVNKDQKIPPSLANIFKEIKENFPATKHQSGDLTNWAEQGVFLLNSTLTVEPTKPNSHVDIGWEIFTNNVLLEIATSNSFVIFILWGKNAQSKKKYLNLTPHHFVFESSHPSPLSAYHGFTGSEVFKKINDALIAQKKTPIDWSTN